MRYFLVSVTIHLSVFFSIQLMGEHPFHHSQNAAIIVELHIISGSEATELQDKKSLKSDNTNSPVKKEDGDFILVSKKNVSKKDYSKKGLKKVSLEEALHTESFLKSREGQDMLLSYSQQLKVYLEQNKTYPRVAQRLKHSGTVKLKLSISTDGEFGKIEVVSPSPFNTLNHAAVTLLKDLGRFKPLPKSFKGSEDFVIPIAYKL